MEAQEARHVMLSEEDLLRSDIYGFLGRILFSRPGVDELAALRALSGDDTPFGQAFSQLADTASRISVAEAGVEYDALFIGLGRGELVPYGSYYLTGFLHEKPLARLRATMRELGISRAESVREPEDHIGAMMEMMAGLIAGHYGGASGFTVQRDFFATHVDPWAGHFFRDLEAATTARLYAPVGRIGGLFMDIERAAFSME